MRQSHPTKLAKKRPRQKSAWDRAEAAGVDMSLIEHSLGLSVWERLVEHQHALDLAEMLQNANYKTLSQK